MFRYAETAPVRGRVSDRVVNARTQRAWHQPIPLHVLEMEAVQHFQSRTVLALIPYIPVWHEPLYDLSISSGVCPRGLVSIALGCSKRAYLHVLLHRIMTSALRCAGTNHATHSSSSAR
jgi:hypothetical protein